MEWIWTDCASLGKHFRDQRLDPTQRLMCVRRGGGGVNDTQFELLSWSCKHIVIRFQINCFKGTSEEVSLGNPPNSLKLKPFTLLSDLNHFDSLHIQNLMHPCLVSSAVICLLAY